MALGTGLGTFTRRLAGHERRSIGPLPETNGLPRPGARTRVTLDTRERWRIDPDRSRLQFIVGQQLVRGLRGEFRCWGGLLLLDKTDLRRSAIRLWVDLSSFDTGSAKHDERMRVTELFDVQGEPALVFDSERVQLNDTGRGIVIGRLAVHCVDREAAVTFEAKPPQRDSRGVWHLVYDASTSIDFGALRGRHGRSRTGWLTNLMWGQAVQIVAHIEAARDGSTSSGFQPSMLPRRWDSESARPD